MRREVLDASPEIADILGAFGAYLDDAAMSQLNARVDLGADGAVASGDEESPADVALSFLQQAGLIKLPPMVVASKDYTEQLILGNIVKLLLENAGFEVEDRIGLGGSRVVREAMLQGEVDVYVELTGSALAVHNGLPSSALPTDADKAYELAKSLDERNGIIWLQRGLFNDTYALMARDDLIDQGLASISDLADYMNANDAPLSICVESDFYGRPFDGLLAMQEQYGFAFKDKRAAHGLGWRLRRLAQRRLRCG
ncbi:MAG: glycine betaine ABC transporter substrate-binding protein [Caldilineaceae bacterium]